MKTNRLIQLFFLLSVIYLQTCKEPEKEMLVSTGAVTDVTNKSAKVSGKIIDMGEGATEHGHCYGKYDQPDILGPKTEKGTPSNNLTFISELLNLEPETKYFVRAYISRGRDVSYGSQVDFTTTSNALPVLTTAAVTDIKTKTAVCGGTITDQGGTPVIHRGVCWSLSTGPTTVNSKTDDGSGTGSFPSSITGLESGVKYYVRAYAENSGGTAYGNEQSFTTLPDVPVPPTVTTAAVTLVTSNSAVCGGEVTSEGSSSVSARGVCWSKSANPTILNSTTTNGTGPGGFISNITGLDPGTKYYVRAYATNSAGTGYGAEDNFTTTAVIPTLTTIAINSVTSTTAGSGGNIISDGGAAITARGVCWSTSSNPTTADSHTNDDLGVGTFTSSLTGLAGNTTYYVRAYATNSVGTAYGNVLNFETDIIIATVTTTAVSSITSTTSVSGGNITSDGGSDITARGVCWSISSNPTISDSKTIDGSGTGPFTSTLIGLTPGTLYHVRAYAINSSGIAYGANVQFLSAAGLPTVTTAAISNITSNSASSGGNVTLDGGAAVTARGVCWSLSANPTISDSKTMDGSGTGPFTSNITDMTAGAAYHVRAYATNSVGTAYGTDIPFTTGAVHPTVTTSPITSITSSSASSGGNVTSDGGATVTARGVCWSTSVNPTTNDLRTIDSGGTGSYTSNITGLTPGTTYHVRAYATNSAGTSYGLDLPFISDAVLPTVTTSGITGITSTTASCGGNVTSDGGATVTSRGVCWSTTLNPTIADSKTSDGNGTGNFSSSINGLTPGASYHVRAYATNSKGTAYGADVPFTAGAIPPTVTTAAISSKTSTTATSGGTVTSEGGSPVTVRGVCWSADLNPDISDNKTTDGTGSGAYISTITGLTPGTTYYAKAYATNSAGTSYGDEISFKTDAVLPTLATTAITSITSISASGGGSISSDGGSPVTARGVCWSTSQNPTTANSKTSDGTGSGPFTSTLSSLSSNTVYYVRAYATNSVGTAYGDQVSFTSLAIVSTNALSNIAITTASGGGVIDAGGWASITARGVCWSTSTDPTIANSKTNDGTGTGTYASSLSGLTSNTIYYVRAYVTNAGGTSYGNQQIFTSLASLTTTAISNITVSTSSTGGSITVGGGANITARGVCWSTSSSPTTSNSKTSDGTGTGSFTSNMAGLASNTVYYVRSFATNAGGTSYGNQLSFTSLATLTTTAASNITGNSASSGGTITVGGSAIITARGVCWSLNANPTTSDSHSSNGTGTGIYTSAITGLTRTTTYHIRAYATNAGGTAYGDDKIFVTTLCPSSLTFSHTAGSVAPVTKTVTYGIVQSNLSGADKCWITKNLGATNQAASATDGTEAAAGWYWQFNRSQGFKHDGTTRTPSTSWITAINENSNWSSVNDPCRLLLGTLWRIPTNSEWTNVDNNAGWTTYNDTYSSIFKLHAAGYLHFDTGALTSMGSMGIYWTTIQWTDYLYASHYYFSFSSSAPGSGPKARANPLRCIQD